MAGTMIRLYDGVSEYLYLRPVQPANTDAIFCQNYDLGSPQPKVNTEERTNRNGINDHTSLHGASSAKFDLVICDGGSQTKWQVLEELKSWLDPTKRFYLQYQRLGETEVWSTIYRADPWSLVVDPKGGQKLPVSLVLTLPEGIYESQPTVYELRPTGLAVGFSFPLTFPFSMTASSGTGVVEIPVGGSRPVPFKAIIYGGQNSPVIMDTDTGRKLSFTANGGLDIPLGTYVELDTDKGTALLNGDPNNSVYQYIDWTVSTWWALRPGETNRISSTAATSDGSAQTLLYVASRRL